MKPSSYLSATLDSLRAARERHGAVLVACSGGRDSRVLLDLCVRVFDRVAAYHYFLVPHALAYVRERMAWIHERFPSVSVHYIPSVELVRAFIFAHYVEPHQMIPIPLLKHRDMAEWAREATGIELVANGAKRADSLRWRGVRTTQGSARRARGAGSPGSRREPGGPARPG